MIEHHGFDFSDDSGRIRFAYTETGDPQAGQTVFCVHGLTRCARDFDTLAQHLAARGRRVIAVDIVGRGDSSWLAEPMDYGVPTYARHCSRLLEALDCGPVDWIGTSMGGLIGMALAAAEPQRVRRLVLNDVGPVVPRNALETIAAYLSQKPHFDDLDEVEAHLRQIHAPFGPLDDDTWHHLARHSARPTATGWRLHYDPMIRAPFMAELDDLELWWLWKAIECPCLVIHGADSELLTDETVAAMRKGGPPVEVVTFEGIGHAPTLTTPDQIAAVEDWLSKDAPARRKSLKQRLAALVRP